MSNDPQPLIQGLAQLETKNAERLERLGKQQVELRDARALDRFIYLVRSYDPPLAKATWDAFEPAIPLTQAGFGFAFTGFMISVFLLSGLTFVVRRISFATA
jgi:hypothetical protein